MREQNMICAFPNCRLEAKVGDDFCKTHHDIVVEVNRINRNAAIQIDELYKRAKEESLK